MTETLKDASARAARRQPIAMRPRRQLLKLHRWIGLVLVAWALLQGLTGATLTFADQLNAWSRPELYERSEGDVGPDAALAAAREVVPEDGRVGTLRLPTMEDGVYVASVTFPETEFVDGRPEGKLRYIFVDPGTGDVNGIRDPNEGFTHWVDRLHGHLLQDELLGVAGTTIVGALGIGMLVLLVTGFYIWYWPGVKRWANALRVRRGRTRLVFHTDLHRLVGILSLVALLVLTVTGLNLTFHDEARRIWYAVTPGPDVKPKTPPPAPTSSTDAGEPIGLAAAVDAATEAVDDSRAQSVTAPFAPDGVYSVRVTTGWDPIRGPRGRGGNATVVIDQYSGETIRVVDSKSNPLAAQLYESWSFPTHAGSFGGFATRVLWVLAGLSMAGLSATGAAMYLHRRKTKARRKVALTEALKPFPPEVAAKADRAAELVTVAAGESVVRQDETADTFYVIVAGTFDVFTGGVQVRTLQAGQSFGEIGILTTGVRTATVTATTAGELVAVPTADLHRILERAVRDGMDLHAASAAFAADFLGGETIDVTDAVVAAGAEPAETNAPD